MGPRERGGLGGAGPDSADTHPHTLWGHEDTPSTPRSRPSDITTPALPGLVTWAEGQPCLDISPGDLPVSLPLPGVMLSRPHVAGSRGAGPAVNGRAWLGPVILLLFLLKFKSVGLC